MKSLDFKNQEVDFFKEISSDSLSVLKSIIAFKKYIKGSIVIKPGERGFIYVVNSGRVELYNISDSGKKFIFSILKKGRIFGDFDLEIGPILYAKTIEDSTIGLIKTKTFLELLIKEPQLLLKLFKYFYLRLLIMQKKALSLASDDVLKSLVKLLIQISHRNESRLDQVEHITDKYTHEQLSQMLGVSRQTVTTIISGLQKKGLLKRKKKTFIFKKEDLEKIIK
ncbi:MAG: Crp/Fnr family transcriptional regulator [bacterium]|nr:Crp/Fnr family transcriptional regulator [bacterium]